MLNFENYSNWEVVPLGMSCSISHYLRSKGLRKSALPFDWNVTPISASIELIENDFSGFLAKQNLTFLSPVKRLLFDESEIDLNIVDDIITPVVNKKYRILFPHDFPQDYESSYEKVIEKYQRRIHRLEQLLTSNLHVVFVYHEGSLNKWQIEQFKHAQIADFNGRSTNWKLALSNLLETKFPLLNYSLLDYYELVEITKDC